MLTDESGYDVIFGGNDTILTGEGNDRAFDGTGNDRIVEAADNDYMDGGSGDDVLIGDAGNAVLTGADRFVFSSGTDRIKDFEGEDDDIELSLLTSVNSYSEAMVVARQSGSNSIFDFAGGRLVFENTSSQALTTTTSCSDRAVPMF
ncbi:MAG: M10 family metallopeptidase C-terminal domain-containing protein [Rhodobacteraceae bacterium]|nr:M10 family metallopeptidase C-terminal domain-containing protein [Paracoccaceae bacterium]